MKILGLDIGANSIGWSLIEVKNEKDILEDGKIIATGSRIFPIGLNEDKFKKDLKEESKNLTRRTKRSVRRRRFRFKLRRKMLQYTLKHLNMLPESYANNIQVYQWRAEGTYKKLDLEAIGTIFLNFSKKRGFKSSAEDELLAEGDEALGIKADKEAGKVQAGIKKLEQEIADANCTLGQYFYGLIEQNKDAHNSQAPVNRIRNRYVSRKLYEDEFDIIWNTQAKFYEATHPTLFSKENKKEIWKYTFYQRDLKSQKHLINKCRFEKNKTCSSISAPIAQEFRLWQQINNIRFFDTFDKKDKEWSELNHEQRQTLFDALCTKASMKFTEIGMLLFPKQKKVKFNFKMALKEGEEDDRLKGNITYLKLLNALGQEMLDSFDEETLEKVWHWVYFRKDRNWLKKQGIEKLNLSEEKATDFSKISLEKKYANLSSKAMKKILPYLKDGLVYSEAAEKAGYKHSYDEEKDNPDRELLPFLNFLKSNELRNPIVQRALTEVIKLVNVIIVKHGKPDLVRIESARELRKPKKKREEIYLLNRKKQYLREEHAKFLSEELKADVLPTSSLINKYELWLELMPDEEYLKEKKSNLTEFLDFAKNVNSKTIQKYQLWRECRRISVYTGKVITLTDILKKDTGIEIEHIIPYSKSMDDSFANKTLCERDFNLQKGGRTPYQYIMHELGQAKWEEFCDRAKNFPEHKQEKLLKKEYPDDNFLESQLRNTAYIARKAREIISTAIKKVELVKGQGTAIIRHHWGLNNLLSIEEKQNIKNRGDHRHHAIDAIVIALTDKKQLDILSKDSYFDQVKMRIVNDTIAKQKPWKGNLFNQAKESINGILISHRKDSRLIYKKKGKIKTKDGFKSTKSATAVRGALHADSYFGKIIFPHNQTDIKYNKTPFKKGEEVFAIKMKLSEFKDEKQLEFIIDKTVYKTLKERVKLFGGNVKKAFEGVENGEILMYVSPEKEAKGVKVPIKSVRVAEREKNTKLILLKPKENAKMYVKADDNFVMGVYESADGKKRNCKVINFFNAVQATINKDFLLPKFDENNYKLIYTMQKGDMFVLYEKDLDETEWDRIWAS
jgi:CRISPR-associated endonuclease Csn1